MDNLTSKEESRFVDSVLDTVKEIKGGEDIHEAVYKIATDRQYTPEFVKRLSEAVNKSRTVHILKTAGVDKTSEFDLIDPKKVIHRMFPDDVQKTASNEISPSLPESVLDKLDASWEKEASEDSFNISYKDARGLLTKYANLEKKIKKHLQKKSSDSYQTMLSNIDVVVDEFKKLPTRDLEKTSRLLINAYPVYGAKLVSLINSKSNRKLPIVERTAKSAILPSTSFFNKATDLYSSVEKYASREAGVKFIEKEAIVGPLGHLLTDRFLGEKDPDKITGKDQIRAMVSAAGLEGGLHTTSMGSRALSETAVLPEIANKLNALDKKKVFFETILYDDKFKDYSYKDLVKAYQQVVQVIPKATKKPLLLSNFMLRILDTGGVLDPMEALQASQLGKVLEETENLTLKADQLKNELAPERDYTKLVAKPDPDKDSYTGKLKGYVDKRIADSKVKKERAMGKDKKPLDIPKYYEKYQASVLNNDVLNNLLKGPKGTGGSTRSRVAQALGLPRSGSGTSPDVRASEEAAISDALKGLQPVLSKQYPGLMSEEFETATHLEADGLKSFLKDYSNADPSKVNRLVSDLANAAYFKSVN